jgi:hypothetical protein
MHSLKFKVAKNGEIMWVHIEKRLAYATVGTENDKEVYKYRCRTWYSIWDDMVTSFHDTLSEAIKAVI